MGWCWKCWFLVWGGLGANLSADLSSLQSSATRLVKHAREVMVRLLRSLQQWLHCTCWSTTAHSIQRLLDGPAFVHHCNWWRHGRLVSFLFLFCVCVCVCLCVLMGRDSYSSQEYLKVQEFERPLFWGLESPRESMKTRQVAEVAAGNVSGAGVAKHQTSHSLQEGRSCGSKQADFANEINQ